MISVHQVTKKYDVFSALNKVSLNVRKGSVYGLIGPNGAGKTTLIKILAGIYRQDEGLVTIDKKLIYENVTLKQSVVYIPDEIYSVPMATPNSMAKLYSGVYPLFDWDRFKRLQEVLKLNPEQRISKMSKGMKKQVYFWLIMSCKPEVMILDEPVDGLDPVMRRQIWSILLQDVAEREMTVLISSHNLRELEDVCDCVGVLSNGEILIERDLDELKTDIHKLQVVYPGSTSLDQIALIENHLKLLKKEQVGSVLTYIVRGQKLEILPAFQEIETAKPFKPLLLEFIPLTLEEIFIYEMGGAGYEVANFLL